MGARCACMREIISSFWKINVRSFARSFCSISITHQQAKTYNVMCVTWTVDLVFVECKFTMPKAKHRRYTHRDEVSVCVREREHECNAYTWWHKCVSLVALLCEWVSAWMRQRWKTENRVLMLVLQIRISECFPRFNDGIRQAATECFQCPHKQIFVAPASSKRKWRWKWKSILK